MTEMRKQAIAGVTPVESEEALLREVWPSISATALGTALGRVYQVPGLGRLVALVTLPVSLGLYLRPGRLLRRYTLTNRRVLIRQGMPPKERQAVRLDEIVEVRVEQRPGQEYFRASDLHLVGSSGTLMTLAGVVAAEALRHHILSARRAYVTVREARRREQPAVA